MKILIAILLNLFLLTDTSAQQSRYFFKKLTVADGLNDGGIMAVAQDNKGFMWFSSRSGLNRYDGYSVKNYSHIAGDSSSIPTSLSRTMSADSSGGFLVGLENGMLEYNSRTDRFTPVKALQNIWVTEIVPVNKTSVYLATSKGLVRYNPVTKAALFYTNSKDSIFKTRFNDIERKKDVFFLASNNGLFQFNIVTEQLKKIELPLLAGQRIAAIAIDKNENVWVASYGKNTLIKFSADFRRYETYNQYFESDNKTIKNFVSMLTDLKGRLWITTQIDGLLLYNEKNNSFDQFLHDPLKRWTPNTNLHGSVFCDREGTIWIGGNNGVNYFNPDKNLFRIIPTFNKDEDIRNRRVARIAVEDKNGKLWFGSIDGIVRFDPLANEYKEWNNRENKAAALHYNSIRGLLCDDENNIWIATGKGINKYLQKENRMIFYSMADSIPTSFYFSADKDRNGNFWFSTRDYDGFYYYNLVEKKFHSIRSFKGLQVFAGFGGRKLFHDSKGRYWLGFNGEGLGMFDPSTGKHYHWKTTDKATNNISGDFIVDITEDKKGIVWISSFTGLTAIDPVMFKTRNYNHTNGLINNSVSGLAVDEQNRLWLGTGSGLMMLDSNRSYFTTFGLQHGLPSIEFPEHAASVLPNGDIMMGTQNGFIRFSPNEFKKENKLLIPFLTTLTVLDHQDQLLSASKIKLHYDENFFTIGFAAINYDNAGGTWYAYKLDGVDEDWKYTQNRFANYTKLPGGNYTFRVKASVDRAEWNGPEQTIDIYIATVFYKAWWFRLLIAVLFIFLVYLFYRYRIRQQQKLLELQGKAQLLEKEKVMVMYESLKQQLNPHFLFNSLTSLSGLIQTDQKMAGNFLEQMSKIYRYILKNRDSELVSLKEELAFVQVYINLQKTRFKEGLQVKMNVSEDELHKKIAPVTLQNLVENAMKHNIIDLDTPLVIEITSEDGYLLVKNNLQKKNMVETSNKQGLASLQSLYQYLSRRPVLIEETKNEFIIRIPLI
ncbi:ligand-binding sensor domain-containing protein [Lacibacter sp.]|uniref:ligand-binding sensor domain-containing protein n=1 Tax=Lacibacter sp. TaxID=1915409 RepID=UPI002B4AC35D|nr:two-component regulator propeller domain-containing protein [Lacibacter sp.]HLP36438.1 two-component regulator propeller domain-containing protein [Lacibacter sp.]